MSRQKWILLAITVAAVAVRLIRIDQPFIDQWSWRQSDVAAIARNYYTGGFHFAYPQIDWAGSAAGYVGTEFPILPFLAAISYKSAGVHEWIGRAQAVVLFAAGLPFFFLLVQQLHGTRAALWSTFFYAFAPLSVATSRSFMPDMPSLSIALVAMYFYVRWLDAQRRRDLLVAALLLSAALLVKITTALIGVPLLYLTWRHFGRRTVATPALWVFGAIVLLPSVGWYVHAYSVAQRFYPHHFFGAGGFVVENAAWYWRIAKQTVISSLTIPLTIAAALGGVISARSNQRVFHSWLIAMLVFILVVGWGNRHQWYQLPLVPIAAVFAGSACEWLLARGQRALLGLLAVIFLGQSAVASRPFFASAASALRDAGLALKQIAPANALVIAADDGDPTIFYYAERKGWHFLEQDGVFYGNPLDDAQLIADYDKLRSQGASYIVVPFGERWWLQYYSGFATHLAQTADVVHDAPEFVIYAIRRD